MRIVVVPVIGITVLPLISLLVSICTLAKVKELVRPSNEAGSHGWAKLMQHVALASDMISFSTQSAPLLSTIAASCIPLFFVLVLVYPG